MPADKTTRKAVQIGRAQAAEVLKFRARALRRRAAALKKRPERLLTRPLPEIDEALLRAESISPQDPEPAYARATIHAQLNQPDEARLAARRVLELRPDHPEARALLQSLQ